MEKELLKKLKRKANEIKPQFNLGKAGLTNTFIDTIDKYLTAHNIVKIKSQCAGTKDESKYFAKEVSEKTKSIIIDKKGFTFVLYRK